MAEGDDAGYLRRILSQTILLEDQIDTIILDAVERYGEPGRYYHDFAHAYEVVVLCNLGSKRNGVVGQERASLLLAALWHDIIYDAKNPKGYNERLSANHARDMSIVLHIDKRVSARVEALIMETVDHKPSDEDIPAMILVDADLERFAWEYRDFVKNNDDIRKEFSHVSDEDWRAGRAAVLYKYLVRNPFFYLAEPWQTDRATLNIVRSLRELESNKEQR